MATGQSYVDFVDPQDKGRKVRIIAENRRGTPTMWAESARNFLRTKSTTCGNPYRDVAMVEQDLAGSPGVLFENTCSEGATKRHGLLRTALRNGKMHSFHLSTTEARFTESRLVADETAGTFEIAAEIEVIGAAGDEPART
ncbi:hypothetical protein [Micromonospora noduli]|uniref:hypothetical protein n=1 Tax=Micromonospora noduli TaxID=709876 RepID=UPI000DBFD3E4|nr:hypothetical protein [Micromonospora noduli]RAO08333.1 hypothetical protein GUI43_04173 [Micromonospora noduli]